MGREQDLEGTIQVLKGQVAEMKRGGSAVLEDAIKVVEDKWIEQRAADGLKVAKLIEAGTKLADLLLGLDDGRGDPNDIGKVIEEWQEAAKVWGV